MTETAVVVWPVDQTFDYLVDFSNADEWDPGIESARRVGSGPIGVGSEFDLVARFWGASADMRYRIEEIDAPHRIRVRGTGSRVVSIDTIELRPQGDQTHVTYKIELTAQGVARLFEPLMRGTLDKMGKKALRGLEHTLATKRAA